MIVYRNRAVTTAKHFGKPKEYRSNHHNNRTERYVRVIDNKNMDRTKTFFLQRSAVINIVLRD